MYFIKLSSSAKKDLKKLPQQVQDEIKFVHSRRIQDCHYGIKLKGELKRYCKYAFQHQGVAYRIAYEIKKDILLIVIIIIGTRENFYKELKRRVKFSSPGAALIVLALAISIFTLAPWAAWGQATTQQTGTTDERGTIVSPLPPNTELIKLQAGRFGLNAVAKLLGLATECPKTTEQGIPDVEKCEAPDLRKVVLKLIQVALGFTSLIALIFMLYGGFTWITAAGNMDKVKKGRDILIWAGIGLVAVMFAWGIVTYVIYISSRVVA
ncbi:MAG: Cytotoxic translational repressor of toxin-antitoxin stability system [Parcubacteria group bacterium GW2011_GWC2_44_17]|uniref:Cytotoxic translational repressor of toxin-antitoxin stability system n=1 Tax=Candidatus Jacksonbacteria bacterium RIFCSPLOWO2_02_FULL_44_20 TaxID=1798460 RepID=A0A1G2ADE5_9BACT|nr:MAG: Cytotoxic translational repressor of toxin-antitoxin stability system [Parcubacteria group bacterium GW2011_GWC2_44_17]KKT49306.1 MAG: Cytotoxic translational repressor of toxin-antitoxin stability system [Parcubacteria group bacterium GW2011_GWF2_44_17]OGY71876.1 MAG: hypothetical protein A3C00_01070 [Candidatus Jacksonbacteria bacterium RIFCSPHIGHO2_02_FULL_44_25]OGY73530.1 MAG: hypothetical protein A3H07_03795 [Candidatus Jacksonbacteria bacterium RIFCSPLOWO2_12_FULL_44_15b]OGY74037.